MGSQPGFTQRRRRSDPAGCQHRLSGSTASPAWLVPPTRMRSGAIVIGTTLSTCHSNSMASSTGPGGRATARMPATAHSCASRGVRPTGGPSAGTASAGPLLARSSLIAPPPPARRPA